MLWETLVSGTVALQIVQDTGRDQALTGATFWIFTREYLLLRADALALVNPV
jgi:hypothetical protein